MSQTEQPAPVPQAVRLRRGSNVLELVYAGGDCHQLPAELLRVYSPSADVRGHGSADPLQPAVLQVGKRQVRLIAAQAVGHYALRLSFDDGHDSGIYSWAYLHALIGSQEALWQAYIARLTAAGASRDALPADTQVINIVDPSRQH